MNDVQQRAVAAGFLHALQTTPALFEEWNAIPKTDDVAIGALIQKTMGLTQAPSKDDLTAMATHIDKNLGDQVNAIQSTFKAAPSHVGLVYVMQQNS
jgi:hypothetical protein